MLYNRSSTLNDLASNTKVNLSKTVLVSLSGKTHLAWQPVVEETGQEWHDAHNDNSIRYLSYPLYHNDAQLNSFLHDIKIKVERHVRILRQRRLSIRGLGMVANSLLLSKVWHLLRVLAAPVTWLKEIKKIIRDYIITFWPKAAYSDLCLKRKYGGIGLVDIEDQNQALHLIYIQRILRPPDTTDFLSPWIKHCFLLYTGHSSLLPLFLYPAHYRRQLRILPGLWQLSTLLTRLPPLTPDDSWPVNWYLELPLVCLISAPHGPTSYCDPKKLNRKYLFSDIARWLQTYKIASCDDTPDQESLKQLTYGLYPLMGQLSFFLPESLRKKTCFCGPEILALVDNPSVTPLSPSFLHWTVLAGPKQVPNAVISLSLGSLRCHWHRDMSLINQRFHPPLAVPDRLALRPFFWRQFWSLDLPSSAFTPWWRLLQSRIGYRSFLNRINPIRYPTPLCGLCGKYEDLYHFVVGCESKSCFWLDIVDLFSLHTTFPTDLSIWAGLVAMCSLTSVPLGSPVLVVLGATFNTLWKYH